MRIGAPPGMASGFIASLSLRAESWPSCPQVSCPAPSEYVALPITTEGSILVVKDETFFGGVEVSIAGVELQFQFAFQIEEVQPLKGGGPVGTIVSR